MWQHFVLSITCVVSGALNARAVYLYKRLNTLVGVHDEIVVWWAWRELPEKLAKPLGFGVENEPMRQQARWCFRAAVWILAVGGLFFVVSLP